MSKDLHFTHDLTIATDIEQAIEMRAGEVLTGVPEALATRLLKRPDVKLADPNADVRRFAFTAARQVPDAIAKIVSPGLDDQRIAEDEERAQKVDAAKRARAQRLKNASKGEQPAA